MKEQLLGTSTVKIQISWPADACSFLSECQQHIILQHSQAFSCKQNITAQHDQSTYDKHVYQQAGSQSCSPNGHVTHLRLLV